METKKKQLLIDSIYNNIEIDKFVFRLRSFKYVENRINNGLIENTSFKDIIDGKQRVHCLLDFINNRFKDSYGNYFNDLSKQAQNKFISYRNCTYVELPEDTTDQDVLKTFLSINFSGVPQSKEHIDFIKQLLK